MYAVVGCRECGALWIVEGRPDTTTCRRCGTRHPFDRLQAFVETDDEDGARQARAAMLAERRGAGEAFDDLDSFAEMEARIDDAGTTDEDDLAAVGLDPDAVAAAGERAGRGTGGGTSRRETVLQALRELDGPTEGDVVAYAVDRGVPADDASEILGKLVRAGAASENGGRYRPL